MKTTYILTPFFLDEATPGLEALIQPGWTTVAPVLPAADKQARMSVLHRQIAAQVAGAVQQGARPASIAGDCCTTIGVLAGLQRAGLDPLLIWFDAHGDFNTWETTPSGFLGGMPLAMLVGRGEQRMPQAVGLRTLPEEQVILTDARDLDPGEREAVAGSGLHHLRDVSQLLDYPIPDRPVYVHFDTDVLRPEDAPAMNYLAPGGPSVSQLELVFRHLAQTGQVIAASMSSWNPEMDPDGKSQRVCMQLFRTLLGEGA